MRLKIWQWILSCIQKTIELTTGFTAGPRTAAGEKTESATRLAYDFTAELIS